MTILVLAHKRLFSSPLFIRINFLKEKVCYFNRNQTVAVFSLWIIAILTVTYLGSLYITFKLGFDAQAYQESITEKSAELLKLDLEVQETKKALADNHKEVLESMERISAIKYLTPEAVAVSPINGARP